MKSIFAKRPLASGGTKNTWSACPCECMIELEIQGDRNGYNLVMSPAGYFTADTWHPTQEDVLECALEMFGVPKDVGRKPKLARDAGAKHGEIFCATLYRQLDIVYNKSIDRACVIAQTTIDLWQFGSVNDEA